MNIGSITDQTQSAASETQAARYDTAGAVADKALGYAAEQPNQVMGFFQSMGVGQSVDITV